MNEITKHIEKLRAERGWTVYKLAQRSDLNEQTIYNWFNTEAYPAISALKQICDAFGITLAEFFSEDGMVDLTPDKRELCCDWDLLNKEERSAVRAVMKGYVNAKRA